MTYRPMLVSSGPLRPDSDRYAFEVKWDGFRALVQATLNTVTITSRNGHDMTSRYPELQAVSRAIERPVLLDGEIVCLDDKGNPEILLVQELHTRAPLSTRLDDARALMTHRTLTAAAMLATARRR